MLVTNYKPALNCTTCLLLTSELANEQENTSIDICKLLMIAKKASILPMLMPIVLADMIISFEASANVHVDVKLCQLEAINRRMLDDKADHSLLDNLKYAARTLNEMRNSIGRSETRLQNLHHLLKVCAGITKDLRNTMSPSSAMELGAASRILDGHANNLESDGHHLLLQLQNHHTRVQNQQSVVGFLEQTYYNISHLPPLLGLQLHGTARGNQQSAHCLREHERWCSHESASFIDHRLPTCDLSCGQPRLHAVAVSAC